MGILLNASREPAISGTQIFTCTTISKAQREQMPHGDGSIAHMTKSVMVLGMASVM